MIATPEPFAPFTPAFHVAHRHGRLSAVYLPKDAVRTDEEDLSRLHTEERYHAEQLPPRRRGQFVGGRLAMRALLDESAVASWAVLSLSSGAPLLPPGFTGSISHTKSLAVAILARGDHGLGVDVEDMTRRCRDVGRHVLCDDEREALAGLPESKRWSQTLLRFSVKESLYKALNPLLARWIGFRELAVWPRDDGTADVDARADDLSQFPLEAAWLTVDRWILTTAVARRQGGALTR